MPIEIFLYLIPGAAAGFLSGLLGVGGGLIIVPVLIFIFATQNIDPSIQMQLALGTSLASIVFTSTSSFLFHHKRGAVQWKAVRRISPGIILGTFSGSMLASLMPGLLLKVILIVFIYYVSFKILLNKKALPDRTLPGRAGMLAAGCGIGGLSSLVGIGGGTLSVPFLSWCNLPFHTAIGTSAAIGVPLAISGTTGYLIGGWNNALLPEFSIGFIYMPALFGIALTSVITAPLGTKLAHILPVKHLKIIFSILLIIVASRLLIDVLTS